MTVAFARGLTAVAACLGVMGAALPAGAADLPPVESYTPYTPYNWTGPYVGAAIGVGSTNSELDFSAPGVGASLDSFSGDGLHFALLAGYNHQFVGSNIVLGIEGDVAFNDQDVKASATFGPFGASAKLEHDFSASIRGRLGYLVLERAMAYVTAGLTYGEFDTSASAGPPIGFAFSQDDNEWGFTIGGGLEVAATDNVRVRAEYLYTDYSSFSYPVPAPLSLDMDPDNHTARAAVIYNF